MVIDLTCGDVCVFFFFISFNWMLVFHNEVEFGNGVLFNSSLALCQVMFYRGALRKEVLREKVQCFWGGNDTFSTVCKALLRVAFFFKRKFSSHVVNERSGPRVGLTTLFQFKKVFHIYVKEKV